MTLSSTEGPRPFDTKPASPQNKTDLEKLQPEEQTAVKKGSVIKGLGWLDRFLAVWILLAMIIGILLGNFVEETGPALQKGKFVGVSIPITVGLLVMMYPILCKVRFETLHRLFRARALWIQIGFSIFMNWIVAPLLMVRFIFRFIRTSTNALYTARSCVGVSIGQKRSADRTRLGGSSEVHRHGRSHTFSLPFQRNAHTR